MNIKKIISLSAQATDPGHCCTSGNCPTLFVTDEGTVLVQGFVVEPSERSELSVPGGEDVIAMPVEALRALVRQLD